MTNSESLIDELFECTAPAGAGKTHAIARYVSALPGCSLVRIDVAEDWRPFDLAAMLKGELLGWWWWDGTLSQLGFLLTVVHKWPANACRFFLLLLTNIIHVF